MDPTSDLASDPAAARAALQHADELAADTARQARWVTVYMLAFAVAFGALTLLVGTSGGPADLVAPTAGAVVLMIGTAMVSASQPVRGGFNRRVYLTGWLSTVSLAAAALVAGMSSAWSLWTWVAASVVVTLPLVVAAWTIHRSLR